MDVKVVREQFGVRFAVYKSVISVVKEFKIINSRLVYI